MQKIKVEAESFLKIQKILNSNYSKKAVHSLHVLIEEIQRMTIRDYTASGDFWLSQKEVISQIKDIIQGLDSDHDEDKHDRGSHEDEK